MDGTATGGGTGGGGTGNYADAGTYGIPVNGAPTWQERAVLVMTNAVRVDPTTYKATYGSTYSPSMQQSNVLGSLYPAVAPMRWNDSLGQSARAHSVDMATTPCFQHNSCDGTNVFTRIKSYYTLSGTLGENIAAGYSDPLNTVNQWLCDEVGTPSACAPDDGTASGDDGHRTNIMDGSFKALGTGYAYASNDPNHYYYYWTQDFGGKANGPMPPLVDGSHVFYPSGKTTFAANYAATAAPLSVSVVINGTPSSLVRTMGTATQGHWALTQTKGTACRSYHFEAVDAQGLVWRYPAAGELRTYGEGSCTESYTP